MLVREPQVRSALRRDRVDDAAARQFAETVHASLAAGQPLGVAVCEGRLALYDAMLPDWGNFMVFGDDALVL